MVNITKNKGINVFISTSVCSFAIYYTEMHCWLEKKVPFFDKLNIL